MQETLYFTNLIQQPVHGADGHPMGVVSDMVVVSGELFPRITGLVLTQHRSSTRVYVPIRSVEDLTTTPIRIKPEAGPVQSLHLEEGEARLGHTFLDKQIVDTHGIRVVRVNDLKLALIDSDLRLLGADVGLGGLLRRMHAERALHFMSGSMRKRLAESVIPWNVVDPLSSDRVQLNVTRGRLREMRPADLADVLEQLPASARSSALADLSDEQIADTLSETRSDIQRSIITEMEDERATDILEHMAPDDAVDLLQDLEDERREDLLERMDLAEREQLAALLSYPEDSAGGLMTTELLSIPAEVSVEQAIARVRSYEPGNEAVYYLYIVDEAGRLEGVVSLRNLIIAAPDTRIGTLANRRVHSVRDHDDQEHVAEMIARYNLMALPVLDADGILKGVVTVDDVIDVLREEAFEDISLLSGGSATPVEGMALSWKRFVWLLVVLLAAFGLGVLLINGESGPVPVGTMAVLFLLLPILLELTQTTASQVSSSVSRCIADETANLRTTGLEILSASIPAAVISLLSALFCAVCLTSPAGPRWVFPLLVLTTPFAGGVCGAILPAILQRVTGDPVRGLRPILTIVVIAITLLLYRTLIHLSGIW